MNGCGLYSHPICSVWCILAGKGVFSTEVWIRNHQIGKEEVESCDLVQWYSVLSTMYEHVSVSVHLSVCPWVRVL